MHSVVHHFNDSKLRRRRSLISAQGWSEATTLGSRHKYSLNPERFRQPPDPFRVWRVFEFISQGSRERSNPGLELGNAFGVKKVIYPNGGKTFGGGCGALIAFLIL